MDNVMSMFNLAGRTALVTGSSRGIGRAIVLALASAGARVVVHGSRPDANLDRTVAEARAAGSDAAGIAADLGSSAEVKRLIAAAGQPDILVLNASVQSYQTVEQFTAEEFLRQYEINVRSSFELLQGMLPAMKKRRWGRILAIGSVNQYKPAARLAIYSSTKAALDNLMNNCAREYAPFGITVNDLAPGVFVTDRNSEALKDEQFRDRILGLIPAGRFGKLEECAALALLLCSDAGGYITGAEIPVTGGMHL